MSLFPRIRYIILLKYLSRGLNYSFSQEEYKMAVTLGPMSSPHATQ
jgi:hypothetical protein